MYIVNRTMSQCTYVQVDTGEVCPTHLTGLLTLHYLLDGVLQNGAQV